jgi:hypothetical protein
MRSAFNHALTTAVLLALANGVWAEDERSTHVVVKVVDQAAAPIPGAEVRIDRPTDSVHPLFQADAKGQFAADLRPGSYDLEVRSMGFRSYKKLLHVEQSSEQFVMVSLAVGGCSPCVEVKALSASELEPEVPISSPSYSSLPAECRGQLDKTGVPLFFSAEKGVRYGASLQANHFFNSFAIPLYVWINNTTDSAIDLGSCSMFQGREFYVWSNSDQSMLKRLDFETGSPRPEVIACSADIKITVRAHACTTVSELYLNEMYSFLPGVYSVVERVQGTSTPPQKGLTFQIRK